MPDLDLLVLGAHPDDAEVHAGGLLALCARRGLKAAILDATCGGAARSSAAPKPWRRRASSGCPA